MRLFMLLLEGKANFKDTGVIITLPSPDTIEQAPADLKERLNAIESVDLSGYSKLKGRWAWFSLENAAKSLSTWLVCVFVFV